MVIKTLEELTENFSKIKEEYEKAKAELKELNLVRGRKYLKQSGKDCKCLKCGCLLLVGVNWYESSKNNSRYICKPCEKNISKNWTINNKEKSNNNHRKYYKKNKKAVIKNINKWIKNNRKKVNEYCKKRTKEIKIDVLSHYVKDGILECACCGESHIEFLSIDHVNNDGCTHKKIYNLKNSRQVYRWIQKNNYPDGFRVLCFNCNAARGFFGYCPHERERCNLYICADTF